MKKQFFIRSITIATICMAFVISVVNTSDAQKRANYSMTDYVAGSSGMSPMIVAPPGGGGMGCYTVQVVDCGFEIGEQVWCNFTGSYGPPYNCDGLSCYGTPRSRHCVLVD